MSNILNHSQADIMRYLLIALGKGSLPPVTSNTSWGVWVGGEPNKPDDVITVYNTESSIKSRLHYNGRYVEYMGVQIRVRSSTETEGRNKLRDIAITLDESIYDTTVTIGAYQYLVHSVSRMGDVISLGKELPESRRSLFTLNATMVIQQLP